MRGVLATHLGHRPGTCGKRGSAGGAGLPRAARAGRGTDRGDPAAGERLLRPVRPPTNLLVQAARSALARPSGITAPGLPCAPAQGAPAEGPRRSRCPPRAPSPLHSRRSPIAAPARRAPPSFLSSLQPPPAFPLAPRLPSSPAHPLPAPSSRSRRSRPAPAPAPPPPRPRRVPAPARSAGRVCPRGARPEPPQEAGSTRFFRAGRAGPVSPHLRPPDPAPRGAARSPTPVLNSAKVCAKSGE